jgi:adenylate cyclase
MSDDAEQSYFSDGITEDIITDLSRISKLHVMARNTSFRYKGQVVKPQEIGKELKVKYLLEGSVRKSGDKLRINAQLIETVNGYHVWSDRYDRKLVDVFAVQDEVTRHIVTALAIQLTDLEETAIKRVSTNNFAAYEHFLLGQKYIQERTQEAFTRAQDEFKEAIKLDPSYARSYGALAIVTIRTVTSGWTDSPSETRERALVLAKKAVALDDTLPQAYWSLGFVHLYRNEFKAAAKAVEKATAIAPSYADGYGLLALINNRLGTVENANQAIRLIKKGMKLNPHYTWDYPYNLGRAYYSKGEYQRAIVPLQQALERNENALQPRLFLAASYSGLGMQDDAEWEIEQVLNINPIMSISHLKLTSRIDHKASMKIYVSLLRKAGLPE